MEKILKVCKAPQGKKYVPAVRIAGDYLEKYNYNVNDNVIVTVENEIITIKKALNSDLLQFLCKKNSNLTKFVSVLGLEVL